MITIQRNRCFLVQSLRFFASRETLHITKEHDSVESALRQNVVIVFMSVTTLET